MATIERASSADLAALLSLLQAQFEEHAIETSSKTLQEAVLVVLNSDRWGFFLLAWEDGETVGVAAISYVWTLEHGGKSAWLDELYVVPERRGNGIGSALLDQVIAEVQKEGCLAIDLEVEQEHQRAVALYERKGFERLLRTRLVRRLGC